MVYDLVVAIVLSAQHEAWTEVEETLEELTGVNDHKEVEPKQSLPEAGSSLAFTKTDLILEDKNGNALLKFHFVP